MFSCLGLHGRIGVSPHSYSGSEDIPGLATSHPKTMPSLPCPGGGLSITVEVGRKVSRVRLGNKVLSCTFRSLHPTRDSVASHLATSSSSSSDHLSFGPLRSLGTGVVHFSRDYFYHYNPLSAGGEALFHSTILSRSTW